MSKDDGGAAYPSVGSVAHNSDWQTDYGMSLRDYFAGQALIGIMVMASKAVELSGDAEYGRSTTIAKDAYGVADAMLTQRNKP